LQIQSKMSSSVVESASNPLKVTVEFGGGSELLFGGQKRIDLELPAQSSTGDRQFTIRDLLAHLCAKHLRDRPELFVQGEDIRPGILIVVNEVDSELLGHLDYVLQSSDTILFISTLHGG
jgi:ubiquitin related modifier 1